VTWKGATVPGLVQAHTTDMRLTVVDLDEIPERDWITLNRFYFHSVAWIYSSPLTFRYIIRDCVGRWFLAGRLDKNPGNHARFYKMPPPDYVEVMPSYVAGLLCDAGLPLPDGLENGGPLPDGVTRGPETDPSLVRTASGRKILKWLHYSEKYSRKLTELEELGAIRVEPVSKGKRPRLRVTIIDPSKLERGWG